MSDFQAWPCRKGEHPSCIAYDGGVCACDCHPNWRARAEAAEAREARLREALKGARPAVVNYFTITHPMGLSTNLRERILGAIDAALADMPEGEPAELTLPARPRTVGLGTVIRSGVRPDLVLEGTPEGEPWCTEDRHIVLPSGEACVCGENRMEPLL